MAQIVGDIFGDVEQLPLTSDHDKKAAQCLETVEQLGDAALTTDVRALAVRRIPQN